MLKSKPTAEANDPYKTNVEKVKQKYAETAGDQRWFKPTTGKSMVRILPPWGPGAENCYFFTGALHYNFKIGGRDRAIPCPEASDKGKCPICYVVGLSKNMGNEETKEVTDEIRAKRKYWVNLIDRATNKVKIYGGNQKFMDALKAAMDDPDIGDITDIENGHDIVVERTGTGKFDTRYEFRPRVKGSPIGIKNWKKKVYQLHTEVLEWMSQEDMEEALVKNYPDLLDDLGVKFDSSPPKKSKKAKPEPEEDDDDGEDDE